MKDLYQRLNPEILDIKPYRPGKTVYEAQREGKGNAAHMIKMASNENPFGMSPAALRAVKERAAEGFAYPEVSSREVRLRIANKIGLDADHIILGNGGDGLIYASALTMLAPEDEAIIPEITFPYYEIVVRAMRGKVVFSKMSNLTIDLDDILASITPRTKMIWLANPNNPTGHQIDRKVFFEFYKHIPEDVFLIHDEVYADFAEMDTFPDTLSLIREGRQNLFLIRSFSKIYGLAGVRVGYGVGVPELINMMYRVRPPFDVSVLAQIAAAAALDDDEFYAHTLKHNAQEKAYLYQELHRRTIEYVPTATNFILINIKRSGLELAERLQEQGIIIRAYDMPALSQYIRLTIGTRPQNDRFLQALDKVMNV